MPIESRNVFNSNAVYIAENIFFTDENVCDLGGRVMRSISVRCKFSALRNRQYDRRQDSRQCSEEEDTE